MKNSALLLLVVMALSSCATSIDHALSKMHLSPYDGPRSYQVSLINKVQVEFDTFYYSQDAKAELSGQMLPLVVYNEWENHDVYYFYLHEERPTVAANFREHLLNNLSQSKKHPEIDSLKVYLTELELIVPSSTNGQYAPGIHLAAMGTNKTLGPSRVSMQLFYQCYHKGLVTENTLWKRAVLPMHHHHNTPGGKGQVAEYHLNEAFTAINEILAEFSVQIQQELDSEL